MSHFKEIPNEYFFQKKLDNEYKRLFPGDTKNTNSLYEKHHPSKESSPVTFLLFRTPEVYIYNPASFRTDIDVIFSYIQLCVSRKSPITFRIQSRESPIHEYTVNIDFSSEEHHITLHSGQNILHFNSQGDIVDSRILIENGLAPLTKYPGTDEITSKDEFKVNKKIFYTQMNGEEPKIAEKYSFYLPQSSQYRVTKAERRLKQSIIELLHSDLNFEQPTGDNPIELERTGISSKDSILQICSIDESNSYVATAFTRTGTYQYYTDRAKDIIQKSSSVFAIMISAALSMYVQGDTKHRYANIRQAAYNRIENLCRIIDTNSLESYPFLY